jgi:hypothetical protein
MFRRGIILMGVNVNMFDGFTVMGMSMSMDMLYFFRLLASAIFTHLKSSSGAGYLKR